ERASRCRSRRSSYSLTRRSDVRFREQTGKRYARSEPYRVLTPAVIRKHSRDLPISLNPRPRDGSVVSSLHCMNDPQPEGHMASYIRRRKFLATLGGAAGRVGACATQMAKEAGASVYGTARARDLERVRALGAEPVVEGDRVGAQLAS